MKVVHHGSVKGELPDEWLAEADMLSFSPKWSAYRAKPRRRDGEVFSVLIEELSPEIRSPGVPIFNEDPDTGRSARERVVSILRGFRSDAELPPVEVRPLARGSAYKYKLTAGAHRFYCSLAVGFVAVPAVFGFDWSALDQ